MTAKILVIDDDPNIVSYLEALFTDHGYQVLKAYDGTEALALMKDTVPDLISLDLEMKKQWGPQFYRAISKDLRYRDIPVIIVSGLSRAELAVKKAAAVVKKPFDPEELIKIVQAALAGVK